MSVEPQVTAIRPGDEGYAEASNTYMGRGAPAVVFRPGDASEVAAALAYAVEHDVVLSIRSGGHSTLGFGTNTGGVVIDLSGMDAVDVLDAAQGYVRIESGATWGAAAAVLADHGLALTSGDTTSVGVGGLTLGGGMGWMVRKHGLTIDCLRAVELVTSDGRILRASAHDNADLFWALRGGGGNFGVVTSFEFQAHHLSTVFSGMIGYALEDIPRLVTSWAEAMQAAPDELTTALLLMPGMGEWPAAVSVFVCYAGDRQPAEAALEPLLRIGTVVSNEVKEKPYVDVLEDPQPPPGVLPVVSNTLVRSVDDAVVESVARAYGGGTAGRVVVLRSLGGAMARVPADATAFGHRDVEAMIVVAAFLPLDATPDAIAAAGEPAEAIARHGVGAYAGFLGAHGPGTVERLYPLDTYRRLVDIKRDYDPTNLFNQNFNIAPQ
jgi:FAD/FMN-containing dehydrogenase